MKFPDAVPLNTWWTLPELTRKVVTALVPKRSAWTLKCKKHEFEVWTFSLPQFLTYEESLCNGTELVLDKWFEKLTEKEPKVGSKMNVTVSSSPLEDYTTLIKLEKEDPEWAGSSFYKDVILDMSLWLCPYLQVLFKERPKCLWVKLEPLG